MFDIQKMMKQAQKMQEQMQEIQKELEATDVTGTSGGGSVSITCNGKLEFKSVKIKPEAVGDPEMLEDLILSALQDANKQVSELTQKKMESVAGGLNIPGLKLPF